MKIEITPTQEQLDIWINTIAAEKDLIHQDELEDEWKQNKMRIYRQLKK